MYRKSLIGAVAFSILQLTCFTVVQAQIKPGYIFGINLSTILLNTKGISVNPDMPVGIHFGGYLEIPVTGGLTFNPGVVFSAKGSNYKIDTVEYSLSPIYIEIPANAMYSFGSDDIKVSLFAGPYAAIGVGGYKIEPEGTLKSINFGSGTNDDLKHFDFGLNFGAGLSIRGLLISAQYGIGLANIAPDTKTMEMKNKVIGISVSSLFTAR
jgi:hypothetical protein